MTTRTKREARRERAHVSAVLAPLASSMRGQIFLSNLEAALPLLPATKLRDAFLLVRTSDARRMHEEDYLAHLKLKLQDKSLGLLLTHKSSAFAQFAPDGWVLNVLPFASYQGYYEDATAALTGHASLSKTPGKSTSVFRTTATTAAVVWIAARSSITPSELSRSNAEGARDLLGLVHYGAKTELVAMHLKLSALDVYRPTVVEANPNARFRHLDPINPTESRWGRTVDLDRLETAGPTDEIGGVSELVVSQTRLQDCAGVEFHYLGSTKNDRSTTGTDKKYLDRILSGRDAFDIAKQIADWVLA